MGNGGHDLKQQQQQQQRRSDHADAAATIHTCSPGLSFSQEKTTRNEVPQKEKQTVRNNNRPSHLRRKRDKCADPAERPRRSPKTPAQPKQRKQKKDWKKDRAQGGGPKIHKNEDEPKSWVYMDWRGPIRRGAKPRLHPLSRAVLGYLDDQLPDITQRYFCQGGGPMNREDIHATGYGDAACAQVLPFQRYFCQGGGPMNYPDLHTTGEGDAFLPGFVYDWGLQKYRAQGGGPKIHQNEGGDASFAGFLYDQLLKIMQVSDEGVSGHRNQAGHLLTTLLSKPSAAVMAILCQLDLASASRHVPHDAPPPPESSSGWSEKDILTYTGTAILIGVSIIGVFITYVMCRRGRSLKEKSSIPLEEVRRPLEEVRRPLEEVVRPSRGTTMYFNIYEAGSRQASQHSD